MTTTPATGTRPTESGFQVIDAENVDEFVHSQTTRTSDKNKKDVKELNSEDKNIERFLSNGDKNRQLTIACYDEVLDVTDRDFYLHANTIKSPYGNFILAQAPLPNTCGDHLHLMWMYNVRTVVCLVSPEMAGGYFDLREGGSYTSFLRYTMTTVAVFDEKQGITVYQCELKAFKSGKGPNKRIVYIICCPTEVNGVRNSRMQAVALEYMWAFEEAEAIDLQTTTILVHGETGTRRTASFVATAIMSKQLLETGKMSTMETWVEIRKRRYGAAMRKHDFFSSILHVFAFCAQSCLVSNNDQSFKKTCELLQGYLSKCKD